MKSKFYLIGLVFTLLLSLSACKSKQSAYQAAYEAAKAREMQEAKNESQIEEIIPVAKPTTTENFQKEKVTAVDGNGIFPYCVVIGSFVNKTNAESLKERMSKQGYSPILAQNEKGMYRVIVASYTDRSRAITAKEQIKGKYAPEFSDAWLLEQIN